MIYRTVSASGDNLPAIKFGDTFYGHPGGAIYRIISDLEAISKEEKVIKND